MNPVSVLTPSAAAVVPRPALAQPQAAATPDTVAISTPANLSEHLGSLDYYRLRADDFRTRNPGLEPPDYYLDYGDVYARKFTGELRPKLSGEGQQWVDDTRFLLQEKLESYREEDPHGFAELERDPDGFREFAYDTHPEAYLEAGLADLPARDLARIAATPELDDLLTPDGLEQIGITGFQAVERWASAGVSWLGRLFS